MSSGSRELNWYFGGSSPVAWAICGTEVEDQRVERGSYNCDRCVLANADVNGAENIHQRVLPSLAPDDRSGGWSLFS